VKYYIIATYESHTYYYEPMLNTWHLKPESEDLCNYVVPEESLDIHLKHATALWEPCVGVMSVKAPAR